MKSADGSYSPATLRGSLLGPFLALVLAGVFVISTGGVVAATPAQLRPARSAQASEPPVPPEDDLRETITLLMMVRMKNELGLNKQQQEQVLPLIEEREDQRRNTFRDRRALSDRLKELLSSEGTKDAEFTELVGQLSALDDTERKQDAALILEMKKILTPRQQAQFLLFRQRFRQWLETRMREARALSGGRGFGPQGPGVRRPQGMRAGPDDGVDDGHLDDPPALPDW